MSRRFQKAKGGLSQANWSWGTRSSVDDPDFSLLRLVLGNLLLPAAQCAKEKFRPVESSRSFFLFPVGGLLT